MHVDFDIALKTQGWNVQPKNLLAIPSSHSPLINAARAIAVSAYPSPVYHRPNGKADKYSRALVAYMFRVAKLIGNIKNLPPWVARMKMETMQGHLLTGSRNLYRAITIRDVINSALVMKSQYDTRVNGRKSTFNLNYSPNLRKISIDIPFEETVSGYILSGRIPDTRLASLRAAILYHRQALMPFQGPALNLDGHDPELDYQNLYNRHVRPALFAQHIVQVVWEAASDCLREAAERGMAIDQLLMRKAVWATDIHRSTARRMGVALLAMRELGVPSCECAMVRFADPLPDS